MKYQIFEPKQNFRFKMQISKIPSAITTVHSTDFPTVDNSETTVEQFNYQFYVKGKTKWNEITINIYDPIAPNLAKELYAWHTLGHHDPTRRVDQYATVAYATVFLFDLDPMGIPVNGWHLMECYAKSIDWGKGDWSAEEVKDITLTLRYNGAILV